MKIAQIRFCMVLFLILAGFSGAFAEIPVLLNPTPLQTFHADTVPIQVRFMDAEGDSVEVSAHYSVDSGATWFDATLQGPLNYASNRGIDTVRWLSLEDLYISDRNLIFRLTAKDSEGSAQAEIPLELRNRTAYNYRTNTRVLSLQSWGSIDTLLGIYRISWSWSGAAGHSIPQRNIMQYSIDGGRTFVSTISLLDSLVDYSDPTDTNMLWTLPPELQSYSGFISVRFAAIDPRNADTLVDYSHTTIPPQTFRIQRSTIWDAWLHGLENQDTATLQFFSPMDLDNLSDSALSHFNFGVQVDSFAIAPATPDTIRQSLDSTLQLNATSHGLNIVSPWLNFPGRRIVAAYVRHYTESCCDFYSLWNAQNSQLYRSAGAASRWVTFTEATDSIFARLTTDGSVLSGFGGTVDSVLTISQVPNSGNNQLTLYLSDTLRAGLTYRDTLYSLQDIRGNNSPSPLIISLRPRTSQQYTQLSLSSISDSIAAQVLTFTVSMAAQPTATPLSIDYWNPESLNWQILELSQAPVIPANTQTLQVRWAYGDQVPKPYRQGYRIRVRPLGTIDGPAVFTPVFTLYKRPPQLSLIPNSQRQSGDTLCVQVRLLNPEADSISLQAWHSFEHALLQPVRALSPFTGFTSTDTILDLSWLWNQDLGDIALVGILFLHLRALSPSERSNDLSFYFDLINTAHPQIALTLPNDTLITDTLPVHYQLTSIDSTPIRIRWEYALDDSAFIAISPLEALDSLLPEHYTGILHFIPLLPRKYHGFIRFRATPLGRTPGRLHMDSIFVSQNSAPTLQVLEHRIDQTSWGSALVHIALQLQDRDVDTLSVHFQNRSDTQTAWSPSSIVTNIIPEHQDSLPLALDYSAHVAASEQRAIWYRFMAADDRAQSPWDSVLVHNLVPELEILEVQHTDEGITNLKFRVRDAEGDPLQVSIQQYYLEGQYWGQTMTDEFGGIVLDSNIYNDSIFSITIESFSNSGNIRLAVSDFVGIGDWQVVEVPTRPAPVHTLSGPFTIARGISNDTLRFYLNIGEGNPPNLANTSELEYSRTGESWIKNRVYNIVSSVQHGQVRINWAAPASLGRLEDLDSVYIRMRSKDYFGVYSEWDTIQYRSQAPAITAVHLAPLRDSIYSLQIEYTNLHSQEFRTLLYAQLPQIRVVGTTLRDTMVFVAVTLTARTQWVTHLTQSEHYEWNLRRDIPVEYRSRSDSLLYRVVFLNSSNVRIDSAEGILYSRPPQIAYPRLASGNRLLIDSISDATTLTLKWGTLGIESVHSLSSTASPTFTFPYEPNSYSIPRQYYGDSIPVPIYLTATSAWGPTKDTILTDYFSRIPADLNEDGQLDWQDLDALASLWWSPIYSRDFAPYTGTHAHMIVDFDGIFDYQDIRVFAQSWLRAQSISLRRVPSTTESPFFLSTRTAIAQATPTAELPNARWVVRNGQYHLQLPEIPDLISGGIWIDWGETHPVQRRAPTTAFAETAPSADGSQWLWYGVGTQPLALPEMQLAWEGDRAPDVHIRLLARRRDGSQVAGNLSIAPNQPRESRPAPLIWAAPNTLIIPEAGTLTVEIWSLAGKRLAHRHHFQESGRFDLSTLHDNPGVFYIRVQLLTPLTPTARTWQGWRLLTP